MKFLCYYFLIFGCLFYTNAQQKIRSIASGTSFGFCLGYCQKSVNITGGSLKVLITKRSNNDDKNYPPLRRTCKISSKQWNDLVSSVNISTFRALPDQIGCPDCADGGAEWIEINSTDGSKKVTFEFESSVEGIDTFLKKIRQLREKYLSRLD